MKGYRPGVNRAWQEADYGLWSKKIILISAMQKMWMWWSLKKEKGNENVLKIHSRLMTGGWHQGRVITSQEDQATFPFSATAGKSQATRTHTYDHLRPPATTCRPNHTHTKEGRVLRTGCPDAAAATWSQTNNPTKPLITGAKTTPALTEEMMQLDKVRKKWEWRGKNTANRWYDHERRTHVQFQQAERGDFLNKYILLEGRWPSMQRWRCVLMRCDL